MKCIIMGDSISEGIGSRRINYEASLLSYCPKIQNIINMAKTGSTIMYGQSILKNVIAESPDIVIIMYGSVDAQIRANIHRNRFGVCNLIPKRYRIGGMLDPRAFYSKKWYRILPDRLDNIFRYILKKLVLLTQGKTQLISLSNFKDSYDYILHLLSNNDIKIIAVSTMYIDDKYFLHSSSQYEIYNSIIANIAEKYGANYVDLYNITKWNTEQYGWNKLYSHDHFHPNEDGYKLIARAIAEFI